MDLAALQPLRSLINDCPESFASGSDEIRVAALNATKFLFDLAVQSEKRSATHIADLLGSAGLFSAPQTRSQNVQNGKRRRSPSLSSQTFKTTPITSLFLDGMNEKQVWAQLDLRTELICDTLDRVLEGEPDWYDEYDTSGDSDTLLDDKAAERVSNALEVAAHEEEVDFDASKGVLSDEDAFLDDISQEDAESEDSSINGSDDAAEDVADLQDSSTDESEADASTSISTRGVRRAVQRGPHSDLNDGFFDLALFNKATRQAEARSSSRGRLGDEDSVSDDEEEIPLDLFAPLDAEFEEDTLEATMYRDFFEPPGTLHVGPRLKRAKDFSRSTSQVRFNQEVRVKKIKAKGKSLPLYTAKELEEGEWENMNSQHQQGPSLEVLASDSSFGEAPTSRVTPRQEDSQDGNTSGQDQDNQDVVERLEDDLFADEDSSSPLNLSTHEKRMEELHKQIAVLESENVGPKEWVLLGEATSRARPHNSLLEEDLEFERAMKVAPSITQEKVHDLEERIKSRILEGRFNDVIRRRKVEDKPFWPSRLLELRDTKSAQSLAQIYEDEFVASRTGDLPGEDRNAKLKEEHDDIAHLWEKLCYRLDALCNAHFTPKPPKATISTVLGVSATSLESALPSTKSPANMLAPEEMFAPSTAEPRARSELTPLEKRTLRNKKRKMRKKSRDILDRKVTKLRGIGGIKKQQKAVLDSVVKSGKGITIVGKSRK